MERTPQNGGSHNCLRVLRIRSKRNYLRDWRNPVIVAVHQFEKIHSERDSDPFADPFAADYSESDSDPFAEPLANSFRERL